MIINTQRINKVSIKRKEYLRKYMKLYMRNYKETQKYKESRKRYRQTEKYLINKKKNNNAYQKTEKRKQYRIKWNKTIQGKYNHLKCKLKRKEIKNNCKHSFYKQEWLDKIEATKGICPCCKKFFGLDKLTLDHIFPLYWANEYFKATRKRWIYTINDIQPLCGSCNSSKGNMLIF